MICRQFNFYPVSKFHINKTLSTETQAYLISVKTPTKAGDFPSTKSKNTENATNILPLFKNRMSTCS